MQIRLYNKSEWHLNIGKQKDRVQDPGYQMLVPQKSDAVRRTHYWWKEPLCMSITVCHNGLYCHQMLMWLSTFASLWCLKVATNQLCLLQFFASNALQFEGKHQNS
jgi:hypothetical protein